MKKSQELKKISYEDDFSDSNSTIIDSEMDTDLITNIAGASTGVTRCRNDNCDDEIESILKKYSNFTSKKSPALPVKYPVVDAIELSSDEDLPTIPFLSTNEKKCRASFALDSNDDDCDEPLVGSYQNPVQTVSNSKTTNKENINKKYEVALDSDDEDLHRLVPSSRLQCDDAEFPVSSSYRNDTQTNSKSRKRCAQSAAEKEEKKRQKAAEKLSKQEEAARQKQMKQALLAASRNMKPENCMKFLTVTLDDNIVTEKYGGEILNALQGLEVAYNLKSQVIPKTVTWTRKKQPHISDSDILTESREDTEVKEALLIMTWKEIINLVNEDTLLSHIESVKSILNKSKLFILIYELENYFNYHKRQKLNSHKGTNKKDKLYEDVPNVQRKQVEMSLTELQILHSCSHQLIETPKDMGEMIAHFTKSVALVPFKQEKYQKQLQADWFMSGDNRDCVKVDKNGNGVRRLWQQQLTTFPLAGLEHAEAIIAKYPTLLSLLEECNISPDGEKVLQELPIRRAAGPLTTARRIGPEMSKKMHTYFTSTEGELPI